jgi:septal ring factor EnvC (AmiA/AmiB activator)
VAFAQTPSAAERRAQLQEELKRIEAEMEGQKGVIEEKKQQAQTLQRDIGILDAKIKKTDLAIKAKDIEIGRLSDEITERQISINSLNGKIEREKKSLAQLIRRTSEINDTTLPEVLLSNTG